MHRIVPERVKVAAIFGGNRYLVPFSRGIATPVCALARNDSKYSTNTNLSFVLAGIVLCLGGPEGVVFSVRVCQQRLVGALLNNPALVEHRDFVAENAA